MSSTNEAANLSNGVKRVLIFSLAYYPHVGGAEVALKEITNRISDIEFHMVTLRFGSEAREEKIGNVMVHRVGSGGGYFSRCSSSSRQRVLLAACTYSSHLMPSGP